MIPDTLALFIKIMLLVAFWSKSSFASNNNRGDFFAFVLD